MGKTKTMPSLADSVSGKKNGGNKNLSLLQDQ